VNERGSTIPLILGFFLLALLFVAGSIALGDAFVQQRDLQYVCDGAAAAAAAGSGDLNRGGDGAAADDSLRFTAVQQSVDAYLARDPGRLGVHVTAALSPDREQITLRCVQTTSLAFGGFFGRGHVRHTATSSVRAPVTA
jgi:uncharacterized membrane protein